MSYDDIEIQRLLEALEIPYKWIEHDAVYTIEDMMNLSSILKTETIPKNLFLKNSKKSHFYLVVLRGDRRLDLKVLKTILGETQLSFASEGSLMELLHLKKGAVTPLGVLNDLENRVQVIFDREVMTFESIGVHPCRNTATLELKTVDLMSLLNHVKHAPKIIDF